MRNFKKKIKQVVLAVPVVAMTLSSNVFATQMQH